MAKVRYYNVEVTLNELAKHVKEVPEWEVGVLQAQWGDNAVVLNEDEPTIIERKLPDPRDEFERLAQLYGPRFGDSPYVASVFGNFGPGVNRLADAILGSAKPRVVVPQTQVVDVDLNDLVEDEDSQDVSEANNDIVPAPSVSADVDFADLAGDAEVA